MKTQFKLGEMVRGGPRLRRQYTGRFEPEKFGKVWKPYAGDKKNVEGIYIGCRTYLNGTSELIGSHGGRIFKTESTVKVALIVPNTRTNPIPVLFDSLERVECKNTEIEGTG